jgi:hypothetical protein
MKRICLLGLVAIIAIAGTANASFWLEENFESGQNGWTMNNGTWATGTVDGQHGTSFYDADGAIIRATKAFNSGTSDVIIMTAKWYQIAAAGAQGRAWVGIQTQSSGTPAVGAALARLGTNNLGNYQFHAYNGGLVIQDTGTPINAAAAGKWHDLMIKMTMSTKTIEWKLDGTSGSYSNSALARPNGVTIGYNYSNGTAGSAPDSGVYFDNITVGDEIPEPATLALLALGGLFLRRRVA